MVAPRIRIYWIIKHKINNNYVKLRAKHTKHTDAKFANNAEDDRTNI